MEDVFSFELVEHGIFCVRSGWFGCDCGWVVGIIDAVDEAVFCSVVVVRRAW